MPVKPTLEQQAIIDAVLSGKHRYIGVIADPGAAKTSTMVMAIQQLPKNLTGYMVCYNRAVKEEIKDKIGDDKFKAKTFNGLGWLGMAIHFKQMSGTNTFPTKEEMETDEAKYKKIAQNAINGDYAHDYGIEPLLIPPDVHYDTIKFIDNLVNFTMVTLTDPTDIQALVRIIDIYEFTPRLDEEILGEGAALDLADEIKNYGLDNLSAIMSIGAKVIDAEKWMTYTDQMYYTVKNNYPVGRKDIVIVDEAQDTSKLDWAIVQKALKSGGMMILVGDPNQSINKFKGAQPGSLNYILDLVNATRFRLSATFRCPRRVVRLANLVSPELQAFFDKEGSIEMQHPDALVELVQKSKPEDGQIAIIARTNAPLVIYCLELIKNGIASTILGTEIGQQLNRQLDTIAKMDGYSFNNIEQYLEKYKANRTRRMQANHEDDRAINDMRATLDALKVVIERSGATSLQGVKDYITHLFSEANNKNAQIILSTAHKTKGMEFPTVIFDAASFTSVKAVGNRLVGNPKDEAFVWFVGITRTQERLVVLAEKCPDWLFGHLPGHPGYELPPFTPPTEQPIEPTDETVETHTDVPTDETTEIDDEQPARTLTKQGENAKKWAQERLEKQDFVILDTETTGLKGEIVSLAVIDHAGNALINTLVMPQMHKMTAKATEINGITNSILADAPTFKDIAPTLRKVIKDKIVIAYNREFDERMVTNSTNTNKLPYLTHHATAWHCAMLRYSSYNPDKITNWGKSGGWWKLQEALEQQNIDTTGVDFHNALADVRATLALMQSMAGAEVTAFNGSDNTILDFVQEQWGAFKHGEHIQVKSIKYVGIIHAYDPIDLKYVVHILEGNRQGQFVRYSESSLLKLYQYDTPIGPAPAKPEKQPKQWKFKVGDHIQCASDGKTGIVKEISVRGLATIKLDEGGARQISIKTAKSAPKIEEADPTPPETVTPYDKGTQVYIKPIKQQANIFADNGGDLISVRFDDGKTHAYPRKDIRPVDETPKPTQPTLLDAPTALDKAPGNVIPMKPKKRTIPSGTRTQVKQMLNKETVTIDHLLEIRELGDQLIEERQKEMV